MVPGYYIGGLVGGAACSAITYYGSSTAPSSRTTTMLKVAYANDNLAEDKLDSIGYYHNLIVGQIYSDRKLYTLSDGTPDYNAIVNKCIKLCKVYGIGDGVIKRTSVIETVDFCKKVHLLHKTCLNQQLSQAELIKRSENLLNNNLKLTVVEMDKIKLVNEKVVKVYCSLAPSVIPTYSKDLEQTISKSEISLELKEEILSTAAFVSNSALCAN